MAPTYAHGAGFVALAALDDAQHLSVAVAQAVNIPLQGSRAPAEQLWNALASRRMLAYAASQVAPPKVLLERVAQFRY